MKPQPKPRISFNRDSGEWEAYCDPCLTTLSAENRDVVFEDVGRHLTTKAHRECAVLWRVGLRAAA